jgi:5-methylcytosine-specific restriction endonuclease McrA
MDIKQYKKEWANKNRDKIKKANKEWRKRNHGYCSEYNKKWQKNNRNKVNAYRRKWYTDGNGKEIVSKAMKKYYATERGKYMARMARKRYWENNKNNPEFIKKRREYNQKAYRKNHIIVNRSAGEGWVSVRKKTLEKDMYTCQNCGNKATEVHHKDGSGSNRKAKDQNNSLENLMSVCHKCNIRLDLELQGIKNFNKGVWKEDKKRNKEIAGMYPERTLMEIGKIYNLSRQRVQQIVVKEKKSKVEKVNIKVKP